MRLRVTAGIASGWFLVKLWSDKSHIPRVTDLEPCVPFVSIPISALFKMLHCLAFVLFFISSSIASSPTVTLNGTSLVGKQNVIPGRGEQDFFGGIPFAEPPLGSLRFSPPVPKYNLGVPTFNASEYGFLCLQSSPFGGPPSIMSEDCLTINVLRPSGVHEGSQLPVMVWIGGLGYTVYNPDKYDPMPLVLYSVERGTPVVFVSFNYRQGPLGFPLGIEATSRGALNLGLKDQLVALEWIQRNIAAFGGDPRKVTVFGESAGAISISFFYLNYEIEKYARAAILESGTAGTLPTFNGSRYDEVWQLFVQATPECAGASPNNTFDCLRQANSSTMLSAYNTTQFENIYEFAFAPVIDGPGGTNVDEGTYSAPQARNITTDDAVRNLLYVYFSPVDSEFPQPPELVETVTGILALYPNDPALGSPYNTGNDTFGFTDQWKRVAAIDGDIFFQAPRRGWSHTASRAGIKTFGYYFTDPQAPHEDPDAPEAGVTHEGEVTYVFGGPWFAGTPVPANELSQRMMDYWISFAVSLDPNDDHGSKRPAWPAYTPQNQLNGTNTTVIPDGIRHVQIAFIDAVPEQFQHSRNRPPVRSSVLGDVEPFAFITNGIEHQAGLDDTFIMPSWEGGACTNCYINQQTTISLLERWNCCPLLFNSSPTIMRSAIVLLAFLFVSFSLATSPQVLLGGTVLVGKENVIPGRGVQEFFGGIPYAEPPVGSLRFAPPVPRYSLNVPIFNATNYGLLCPQSSPFGGPISSMDEDCLTINILRPAGVHFGSDLPVMLWVDGLGYSVANPDKYDPMPLVLQSMDRGTPVVFVSFNYRLGPFGFPLGFEATARGALNLGLKDQLVAFEWIQRNIVLFGGDPTKVTIFGESSGAISISLFYLNKEVEKYARAAILESGSAGSLPVFNSTGHDYVWQAFVDATPECAQASANNTFDCLRQANFSTLVNSYGAAQAVGANALAFAPVIDGPGGLVPELPSATLAAGYYSRIPFMSGTYSIAVAFNISTDEEVRDIIYSSLSTLVSAFLPQPTELVQTADALLALYPNIPALGSPFNTGNDTFGQNAEYKRAAAMVGDWNFQALRRLWSQTASRAGVKTFGYLFTDPQAPNEDPFSLQAGVPHESEITYVFGGPAFAGTPQPANLLSFAMMDYWISFAVSLDPNDGRGTKRPNWPQYTVDNEVLLQLSGANTTVIPDDYRHVPIAFINSVPEQFQH
ncbi:Lipase 1 [Grifola frondosa]|uniref:Lipase 1 n=1 Tax=Grifola frondosa TaxID=5627 RepID=A0A1C7LR46_GRIFR|nr:Lipase 1 [Grifola frondosa]